MLVGHFGVGLAAKRVAPRTSLGTLMLASLLPDILGWAFLIAGLEHARIQPGITTTNALNLYDIPISHSLIMDVVWGGLLASAYFLWRRYARGAWMILALVPSHWFLDFLSHRPDIPLGPGIHKYFGLGLYNSLPAILLVEGLFWFGGIIVYALCTRAKKRAGAYLFWGVVVLLSALWLVTLRGAPPPNLELAGISSLIFFSLVLLWAYGVDLLRGNREQLESRSSGLAAGQAG